MQFKKGISMKDSKAISFAKAISWRTTGSLATFGIVFFATGRLELAAAVGGLETVVKIGLFYAHERVWTRLAQLSFFEKRMIYRG